MINHSIICIVLCGDINTNKLQRCYRKQKVKVLSSAYLASVAPLSLGSGVWRRSPEGDKMMIIDNLASLT